MIDAQFQSEERYAKLAIAYDGEDESVLVRSNIEKVIARYQTQPETYTSNLSNGKNVIVIEYGDDMDREAGEVFEEIIKALDIDKCI